jgi:hypothetical protein
VQENHVGVPSVFIASPPIVINGSAIRLTLDVLQPHRGERDPHINVHAIPCDPKGKMLDKMSSANTACLVIDADAGPAMIFAGWDFVAREGVDNAINAGAIVKSWLNVVTAKIPCGEIPPEEEGHAIRMLQVYAAEDDLDRAIVEYRIVDKGKSTMAYKAAASYNKIKFFLEMREGRRDPRTDEEYRGIEYKRDNTGPKVFQKWLLNGRSLSGSYWKSVLTKAEKEIYPDTKERDAALRLRLGNACVDNEIKPGFGFAPHIVPAEFCHCTPTPVVFGMRVMGKGGMIREVRDMTQRTMGIIEACQRLGRARDKDGTPIEGSALLHFKGRLRYDLEGLVILEKFIRSVPGYWSHNYIHHAMIIDMRTGGSARLKYTTARMYGR